MCLEGFTPAQRRHVLVLGRACVHEYVACACARVRVLGLESSSHAASFVLGGAWEMLLVLGMRLAVLGMSHAAGLGLPS